MSLKKEEVDEIKQTLVNNADLFAWTRADMPSVSLDIITHKLVVYKKACPISQKKRKMGEEKRIATQEKVEKLLKVGFIGKLDTRPSLLMWSWSKNQMLSLTIQT